MGYPMAGHLARAGHRVTVYNRTPARAEAWSREHGGTHASSPREAVSEADVVFVCTGNDADLRDVALDDANGALAGMRDGTTLVDHTTASPKIARVLYEAAAARGVAFLDGPVSGGQAGAENGALTIMLGGDVEAYEGVTPLLDCYGRKHALMGPAGAGQLTKAVNQICIAGVLQGLSEGLRFAEKAGLDGEKVVEVISQGAAQSWQMDNRAETMLEGRFDFGFAVDWMRKDLAIAMQEAASLGLELPLTQIVDGFYARLQARGGGRLDTSSLIELLR